jgi:iron complex outermembrane receptor protein
MYNYLRRKTSYQWLLTSGSALILTTIALPSVAAERTLEEVLVTATKREQSLNDIPVAISAYDNEQLKNSQIRDVGELTAVAPSLSFGTSESSAGGNLSLRGMGTLGTEPGLESSVGVFIDGVYRSRAGVAIDELGEVARIEVLRGPQGTLFGKNTSAGLIQVITKAPNFEEIEGFAELTLGNYNLKRLAAAVSGPLIADTLAGRIDAVVTDRDGYLRDINSSDTYNDRNRYMFRGQLAFEASDTLTGRFIADYSDRDELCCGVTNAKKALGPQDVSTLTLSNPNDKGLPEGSDPYNHQIAISSGRESTEETTQWGLSLELSLDLEKATLVSISAYREWEYVAAGEHLDSSGADLFYYDKSNPQRRKFETLTQELRLQGSWEGGSWMVGAFYADEDYGGKFTARYGADLNNYAMRFFASVADPTGAGTFDYVTRTPAGGNSFIDGDGVNDSGGQGSQSVSIFTQEDFDLTEQLLLTVGLRYTEEEKDITLNAVSEFGAEGNPCGGAFYNFSTGKPGVTQQAVKIICGISALTQPLLAAGNYTTDNSDEELTGTVKLAYTLANDTLIFANAATGYKSGGFNQTRLSMSPAAPNANDLAFAPETVTTYELGAKGYAFNRTMSLNGTLFFSEFEDFQLGQFNGTTLETVSVDKVESQGAEIEGTWLASDNLMITSGVVYTDNSYPDDSNIDIVAPTDGGNLRAGARLSRNWVSTVGVTWSVPVTDNLVSSFHLDGRYTSDYSSNSSLDSDFDEPAYTVFNGRVSIADIGQNWSVALWARNLTDEGYTPIQFDPPPLQGRAGDGRIGAFIGEPRTLGVSTRYNF